jgi:hypothetical protein
VARMGRQRSVGAKADAGGLKEREKNGAPHPGVSGDKWGQQEESMERTHHTTSHHSIRVVTDRRSQGDLF